MPKKPTQILLDRSVKCALPFASKDETRQVLTGIHITPDYIAATDSCRLVKITHGDSGVDPRDYPKLDGEPAVGDLPEGGVIIEAKSIAAAVKSMPTKSKLPILNRIAVDPREHTVRLTTTDLESTQVQISRRIEGKFPPVDDLLYKDRDGQPLEPITEITFSADFLKQMAAAFQTFGAGVFGSHGAIVTVEVFGPLKPARFTAENSETGQVMTAMLMPVRKG